MDARISELVDEIATELDSLSHHLPSAEDIPDRVKDRLENQKKYGYIGGDWDRINAESITDELVMDIMSRVQSSSHIIGPRILELVKLLNPAKE